VRNKYLWIALSVAVATAAVVVVVFAGNPDGPPGPPESTYSYTLEDIYRRLDSGAAGTPITFTEPISGPGTGTMHTLDEVMGVAPAMDEANGATQAQVLAGRTAWGLTGSAWGAMTGTMPDNGAVTIVPTTTAQTVAAGYHNGAGAVQGDPDLAAANIRCGVTIFGVTGTWAPRCVAQTGQTASYVLGDDGTYQMGCLPAVAPSYGSSFGGYNRTSFCSAAGFTDNGDGTVTDNLTGLIWLKNANCFGLRDWTEALSDANLLASGLCGLSDGSSFWDWRLPNLNELRTLFDPGRPKPYLPAGHPFTGVQLYRYWSSTTRADDTYYAWLVDVNDGDVGGGGKLTTRYVWPVRGGQ
jgi:hypothetical protein